MCVCIWRRNFFAYTKLFNKNYYTIWTNTSPQETRDSMTLRGRSRLICEKQALLSRASDFKK